MKALRCWREAESLHLPRLERSLRPWKSAFPRRARPDFGSRRERNRDHFLNSTRNTQREIIYWPVIFNHSHDLPHWACKQFWQETVRRRFCYSYLSMSVRSDMKSSFSMTIRSTFKRITVDLIKSDRRRRREEKSEQIEMSVLCTSRQWTARINNTHCRLSLFSLSPALASFSIAGSRRGNEKRKGLREERTSYLRRIAPRKMWSNGWKDNLNERLRK